VHHCKQEEQGRAACRDAKRRQDGQVESRNLPGPNEIIINIISLNIDLRAADRPSAQIIEIMRSQSGSRG
jgi:hypothetical protein